MIQIFVSYRKKREAFDVEFSENIGSLKERVLDAFQIDTRRGSGDKKHVVLAYQGADLDDAWLFGDIGIQAGATLRCGFREEVTPKLYVYCAYNDETVDILEDIKFDFHTVANLRGMITRRTGLPVTVFRILRDDNTEMYDPNILDKYGLVPEATVRLETWDGWNEFLKSALIGQTSQVLYHMTTDEHLQKFQARVALFIAAHYGHMDLAGTLLRMGVRSDEPVGDHPIKEWCASSHVDTYKTPVHEAAEHGQISILRIFVFNNICCVTCKDGNGLTALNVALRKQQREVALYLLTKQWSNVQFSALSLPLSIFSQIKKWCDKAKERVLLIYGPERSSMRYKPQKRGSFVGSYVHVDGFTKSGMNSNPKSKLENFRRGYASPDLRLPRISGTRTPSIVVKYRQRYYAKFEPEDSDENEEDDFFDANPPSRAGRPTHFPPILNRRTTIGVPSVSGHSRDLFSRDPDNESFNDRMRSGKTGRQTYIRTPGTGRVKQRSEAPSAHKSVFSVNKSMKSVVSYDKSEKERRRKRKTASMESSISLPAVSVDNSPERPFYHATSIDGDIPRQTVDIYEKMSGQTTWERAIDALTIASAFKERPWLQQVRMAMDLSKNHVRKVTQKNGRKDRMLTKKKSKVSVLTVKT